MTDKYTLENILTLTKSLTMLYVNGTIESSDKKIRDFMEEGLKENLKLQDELYQSMSDDGYYSVTKLSTTEINKTLTKITNDASN